MADILHNFPINAGAAQVFAAVTTPKGLDAWWTKTSSGVPTEGAEYELGFGPGYDWRAVVTKSISNKAFELKMINAQEDWQDTQVGFKLEEQDGVTHVRFHHLGWPEDNEHYRISCFCWAMYLRLMKRYVEYGEIVSYEDRLEV